ncbi:uncharacterized protein CLUP02_12802 [Colletotrichum lupini]|uniref:Uncharacterized protein n=1 Tax=Colletotrichum lupini TaxID=145971 RepID=A0A9Q8T147_9PEZI|nr:uncharacterized protein CLUP02_12802 [Colletotrichum lupini]UQC87298.1 hypothetical protein CLUP02_12802 [Colletotrichum lupini]
MTQKGQTDSNGSHIVRALHGRSSPSADAGDNKKQKTRYEPIRNPATATRALGRLCASIPENGMSIEMKAVY